MSASVLLAYATRSGSTEEVAQAITVAIRECGLEIDLAPVSRIDSLERINELILGAPLYAGRFPREFHQFLRRHRDRIATLRPWCFVLGPTRNRPEDFEAARNQAMKQLRRCSWMAPAEVRIFGGRWSAASVPFPFSLARRLPANPMSKIPDADIRDWGEIRKWATGIARILRPAA